MTLSTRRRLSNGRITLADVARDAGVSPITASRALRNERRVDPDMAARVLEAAKRLSYVPDPAARALASARTTNVIVLIPMLSNSLFVDLLEGVYRTLMPEGYQTLIGLTHYNVNEEEQLLRAYLAHRPAGLLVTGFERTEATRDLVRSSGLPCVHMMEVSSAPNTYSVGFSQTEAGAAITRHLLGRGRRNIAFVAAQLDPRTMQRAEGYRRAMREANLYQSRLELLNPDRSSMALGGQLFQDLLTSRPEVDAVFFNNDDLAQGGLLAARRLGIDVPAQIAIAGFNDLPGSDQMVPALTTVKTPRFEIGQTSAKLLLQLMRREVVAQGSIDLSFTVVDREST